MAGFECRGGFGELSSHGVEEPLGRHRVVEGATATVDHAQLTIGLPPGHRKVFEQ
ncbi:hypothetical protein O1L68_38645 [Streptomyces lydicus]|nr:hypothetical protein [Streptomyces lydicus]